MPTSFTPEELEQYRAAKEAEKAEAAEKLANAEKDAAKQKRQDLEDSLKEKFIAAGGSSAEWTSVKRDVVKQALITATLAPDPAVDAEAEAEAEKLAKVNLSKNKYR